MSNYVVSDTDMTSVANKIRSKTGGSAGLVWPNGFVNAIDSISGGTQVSGQYQWTLPSSVTVSGNGRQLVSAFSNIFLYDMIREYGSLSTNACVELTQAYSTSATIDYALVFNSEYDIQLYAINKSSSSVTITSGTKITFKYIAVNG